MELFFHDRDQYINRDGNPDLSFHRVLLGPLKLFDAQVLLDPFEEQLDLPPALIQRADCRWLQIELIAQEHQGLFGFWIPEADSSEVVGIIFGGVVSIQGDGLIANETGRAVHRTRVKPMGVQIRFRADHKETASAVQCVESRKVDVTTIHDIDGPGLWYQEIQSVNAVELAVRYTNEAGDIPPEIQQGVHFDG